jgi:hypothetical protein
MALKFKITYATMSADNEELQSAYDQAVAKVKAEWLGQEVPMFINGQKAYAAEKFASTSPIDTGMLLCQAQRGTTDDAKAAVAAARAALPGWRKTPWQERVRILRAIAEKISDNSLELSALMILEVGKNRLEALGEVEETADLLRYYADSMEKNHGFVNELGKLNPNDPKEKERQRPASLRRLGGHFPLQLPDGPLRRADCRRADYRQHRGLQRARPIPPTSAGKPPSYLPKPVSRRASSTTSAGRGAPWASNYRMTPASMAGPSPALMTSA